MELGKIFNLTKKNFNPKRIRIRVRKKTDPDPCSGSTTQQLGTVPVLYLPICPDNLKSFQQIIQNVWLHSHENLVDSDMRDILNGSPHEEENNRSPVSAEAPELSSHSSDEVGYLRLLLHTAAFKHE